MKILKQKIKDIFGIDYRSLALLRIGIGLTIIVDLVQRSSNLIAHYADRGILPRQALYEFYAGPWNFSIHTAMGIWQYEIILFIIAFIFGLFLIIGYKTILSTIISFILLISLQNRNPLILQGGDVIFRVVLFWGMFLPWGKYFSIDSILKNEKLNKKIYLGASTIAYTLQIVIFYLFSGILKTGDAWVKDGTAVYYALSIDQFATNLGHYLLQFPSLLTFLTFFVLYLEIYGSLLLLSPFKTGKIRILIIFLFAMMQIGINSTMSIGLFGMISIVVTLGLLPSYFWDSIIKNIRNKLISKKNTTSILYYDSNCSFCYKLSFIIKKVLFLPKNLSILESTEDEKISQIMYEKNSWVFKNEKGELYFKTKALKELLKISPIFFIFSPLFSIKIIQKISDKIYDKIAKNRLTICTIENKEKENKFKITKIIKEVFLACCILYMILINLQSVPNSAILVPENIENLGVATLLDQHFDMFTPTPLTEDGWYVIPGNLIDNTEVDVFRNEEKVSFEKPKNILYENQRWQKYFLNLWYEKYTPYRLYYGKYLCREWNKTHTGNNQLKNFDVLFMMERTELNNQTDDIVPIKVSHHECFN